MRPFQDLQGQRFGLLTVVSRVDKKYKTHGVRWNCVCDCGNRTVVASGNLKYGHVKACGCTRKPLGDSGLRFLLAIYRNAAKRLGREFLLTMEEFRALTSSNCHYCGKEPAQLIGKDSREPYTYNGVDRVDNFGGYSTSNTVPCCKRCNHAKHVMGYDEFVAWVTSVHAHLILGR